MHIKIGSRESKLAVVQSKMVIENLIACRTDISTELITMKTTGDIILDRTLDKVGGKGLFVKELDSALINKVVDITVHSFKDMPMEENDLLPIVAVSKREDPRDVLILPQGVAELDLSKPLGCSSLRRKLQLEKIYPNIIIEPIRGNVQTRLSKLDNGEYSGIVLAYAGIKRLGLENRVSKIFEIDEILPACCQGILAVQARNDFDKQILNSLHDEDTYLISKAERAYVRTLDGGCSSPVASYATIKADEIVLTGFYVDENNNTYKKTVVGNKYDGEIIGQKLAINMKSGVL